MDTVGLVDAAAAVAPGDQAHALKVLEAVVKVEAEAHSGLAEHGSSFSLDGYSEDAKTTRSVSILSSTLEVSDRSNASSLEKVPVKGRGRVVADRNHRHFAQSLAAADEPQRHGGHTVVGVVHAAVSAESESKIARTDGGIDDAELRVRMELEQADQLLSKVDYHWDAEASARGGLESLEPSVSESKQEVLDQAPEGVVPSDWNEQLRDSNLALANGHGPPGLQNPNHRKLSSKRPDLSITVSGLSEMDTERAVEDGSQASPHGTPSEVVKTRVRLVKKEVCEPAVAVGAPPLDGTKRKKKRVEWPAPDVAGKKRRLSDGGGSGGIEEALGASKKVVSLDRYKAFTKAPNMLMAKLVDEKALLEGTYVQYRGKQDEVLKEGHAFKNGILCR